jgi:hypothetical protein
LAGCGSSDCKDPNRNRYDLEVPLSIAPVKQVYTLNDTIDFSIEVSPIAKNRFNGREETILEFDVGYEFSVLRVDSNFVGEVFMDDTYDNIDIVSRSAGVTDNYFPNSVFFTPQLQNDNVYSASFSFIFKQPGVYSIRVNDYTDEDLFYRGENIRNNIIIRNQCDKSPPIITLYSPVNGGAENNLSVLCEHRPEVCEINKYPEKREYGFDRNGGYIFEVVD